MYAIQCEKKSQNIDTLQPTDLRFGIFFAEIDKLRTIHMHFNSRILLPDGTCVLEPRPVQRHHHLPGTSQLLTIMNEIYLIVTF